ncbi:hexapeptide transferase [Synechococcus sp. Minos11]|nr:hexapeptide transferase [Synechococcus sp. Minos11]
MISIGNNVHIDKYTLISTGSSLTGNIHFSDNKNFSHPPGAIVIGDNIHVCPFCTLAGFGGLEIQDNTVLSAYTKVYSLSNIPNDHDLKSRRVSLMPYISAPFIAGPVVIKKNSWIGLNCIIMPSVTIGEDAFCVSNSVILKSIPDNWYVSGQPAIFKRHRFTSDFIK